MRAHIKNNRVPPKTSPPTPEGEADISRGRCRASSPPSRYRRARSCGTPPTSVVTPHVSADDCDSYILFILEPMFRNLERLLERRPLVNLVRPELGY